MNELFKEILRILVSYFVNVKGMAEGKNIVNVVFLRGCGIRIDVCFSRFFLVDVYFYVWFVKCFLIYFN